MTRRLAMAWAALGALAWAAPADAQIIYDTHILPDRLALGRIGLERGWYAAIPLGLGIEKLDHLSLSEDGTLIFAQTTDAILYAVDAETGRLIWSAPLGRPSGRSQDVATNQAMAFPINGNFLFALDRATGRPIWEQRMEVNASSPVSATEDLVIVGLENGKVIAYSNVPAEDKRFRQQAGPPGGFAWNFQTNGPVTARAIPTQRVVAFGSTGGKLYVSTIDPPKILHRSQPIGAIAASMGSYGTGPESALIVPSMNRNLYRINLFTGEQEWVFPTGAPIGAEPLIGGGDVSITRRVPERRTREIMGPDLKPYQQEYTEVVESVETIPMPPTIYVLNESGELFAIDPDTGESRWGPYGLQTRTKQIAALSPSRVYMRSEYGDLAIAERTTGALIAGPSATFQRAGVDLRAYSLAVTNDVNDRLYLASPEGALICLHEIGESEPIPLRAAESAPFGQLQPEGLGGGPTPPAVPGLPEDDPFGDQAMPDANPAPAPAADDDDPFGFGFGYRARSRAVRN